MTDRFRIMLADDHHLFRRGLKALLGGINGLEVIGEAGDGRELLSLLSAQPPDLVILDISMPQLGGFEALREIRKNYPDVKVLILTMHKDSSYFHEAVSAGAVGYLLKEDTDPDLFSAIDNVRQGKMYVSPRLLEELKLDWLQLSSAEGRAIKPAALSPRETEIVKLIAQSKSTKEIADLLSISERTVDHHRANILRKLNFKKPADLIKYALQKGYI